MACFCPKCGEKLIGSEKFCSNCGLKLELNKQGLSLIDKRDEVQDATCPYCGKVIRRGALRCIHCGSWLNGSHINSPKTLVNPNAPQQPQVVVNNYTPKTNGFGVLGFLFAILAIVTSFIPGLNVTATPVLAVLGLLISFIGLFFPSKGLAIVGFILSAIPFILLAILGGTLFALLG